MKKSCKLINFKIHSQNNEQRQKIIRGEQSADTFEYYHRDVEKEKEYIYALVAIAYKDREGEPTFITIK